MEGSGDAEGGCHHGGRRRAYGRSLERLCNASAKSTLETLISLMIHCTCLQRRLELGKVMCPEVLMNMMTQPTE